MSESIGVLIVEREAIFRRGLVAYLDTDSDIAVLASVATAAEGYQRADELSPDVALVGTTLADAPGVAAAAELRRRFPALATVVVAGAESDDELFAAIRANAVAYVGADISEDRLTAIIKRAVAGDYVINEQLLAKPSLAARVMEVFRAASDDLVRAGAFAPLTDRELEILRKVGSGMTNPEIGAALNISTLTVKNHVTSILRKLAVNDRTQAVLLAVRRGWLSISEEPDATATESSLSLPAAPGDDGSGRRTTRR